MARTPEKIAADGLSRDEAIDAATAAYLKDGTTGPFEIAGRMVDVGEAIQAHPFTRAAFSGGNASPSRRRRAVQAAIVEALRKGL